MHRADPQLFADGHIGDILCTALQFNRAGIGVVDAGEHFDKCGLSCAVFTHQSVNFASSQVKIHIFQHPVAVKALSEPFCFQNNIVQIVCSLQTHFLNAKYFSSGYP